MPASAIVSSHLKDKGMQPMATLKTVCPKKVAPYRWGIASNFTGSQVVVLKAQEERRIRRREKPSKCVNGTCKTFALDFE